MKAIQPPPNNESATMQRNWTTAGCRERWVSSSASAGQASALSSSRTQASAPSWRSRMIEAIGIAPRPLPTKRIQPMRRAAPMPSTATSVETPPQHSSPALHLDACRAAWRESDSLASIRDQGIKVATWPGRRRRAPQHQAEIQRLLELHIGMLDDRQQQLDRALADLAHRLPDGRQRRRRPARGYRAHGRPPGRPAPSGR
ncbi:hypothetical protein G6F65_019752 [Rhizopus arrhizus]|nr:hypothetical protein G6F65_019752 [Rhizopus arrhizus]